ncbi:MAG TPA: hypothetical protein VG838_00635 [Opitutaceae bacterium]|nr:hypothetical protein [Opitutaceae bacterium]
MTLLKIVAVLWVLGLAACGYLLFELCRMRRDLREDAKTDYRVLSKKAAGPEPQNWGKE